MPSSRNLASLVALGLAISTHVATSNSTSWEASSDEEAWSALVEDEAVVAYAVHVGLSYDATEGNEILEIHATPAAIEGEPSIHTRLEWEDYAATWDLWVPGDEEPLELTLAGFQRTCFEDDLEAPEVEWVDEVCWATLELEISAMGGSAELDVEALFTSSGMSSARGYVGDPRVFLDIERIDAQGDPWTVRRSE